MTDSLSQWGTYKPHGLASICLALSNSSLVRSKELRRSLKRYFAKSQSVYDITIDDVRLRCHPKDNSTDRHIVTRGKSEGFKELGLILDTLKPGDTFVDVGANSGLYSLLAAPRVGPGGRVFAIEPNTVMLKRLTFNIQANGFDNILPLDCALSSENGTITLHLDEKQYGRSSITAIAEAPTIDVPTVTLARLAEQHGITRIDALKIDIEGHEDQVLLPLIRSAPASVWPRAILIETRWGCRWQENCLLQLIAAGYAVKWESETDALLTFTYQD